MKLRNKKTGEILDFKTPACMVDEKYSYQYDSLAELNKEWEDAEPKVAYYIDSQGDVFVFGDTEGDDWTQEEAIGNCFRTKEEAEQAVEKLKAWKRLKDESEFEFIEQSCTNTDITIRAKIKSKGQDFIELAKDLDLLFGEGY